MIPYLLETKQYFINVTDFIFWVTAIISIITLTSLIIVPARKLIKQYKEALASAVAAIDDNKTSIDQLTSLYSKQNKCIQEIKNERKLLNEDINTIKKALTTLAKIELDKQCTDALNCGYISQTRLRWLEDVYAIYAPFGENGGVDTTINRVRQLPLQNDQSQ